MLYTMASFLVFYLIQGTLTLPGIAAMLLGIGMAVDASIITFERMKGSNSENWCSIRKSCKVR